MGKPQCEGLPSRRFQSRLGSAAWHGASWDVLKGLTILCGDLHSILPGGWDLTLVLLSIMPPPGPVWPSALPHSWAKREGQRQLSLRHRQWALSRKPCPGIRTVLSPSNGEARTAARWALWSCPEGPLQDLKSLTAATISPATRCGGSSLLWSSYASEKLTFGDLQMLIKAEGDRAMSHYEIWGVLLKYY